MTKKTNRTTKDNPHNGSLFDDFLKEEGIHEEVTTKAIKRVLAFQIHEEMKRQKLNKKTMAEQMKTSRSQLDRLLDPEKTGVSLDTIQRAAAAVGRDLRIELV
jgi:predicted XRE-type DNA-binding protein